MKDGFVDRALAVSADRSKENLESPQPLVLQTMSLLRQQGMDRTTKMQAEEFYFGGIVALGHLNQFQLHGLRFGMDCELGVQFVAKNLAIEIAQRCKHAEATAYATHSAVSS